jgi:hypothetical protein
MGMNNLADPNAVRHHVSSLVKQLMLQMTGMMDNPDFMRSMSEMMSRPEVIDQVSCHTQCRLD